MRLWQFNKEPNVPKCQIKPLMSHECRSMLPYRFAKSQEFSNVRALQIFQCKVLLSISNSRKTFERDLPSPDSAQNLQNENLWFSETDTLLDVDIFLPDFRISLTISNHVILNREQSFATMLDIQGEKCVFWIINTTSVKDMFDVLSF